MKKFLTTICSLTLLMFCAAPSQAALYGFEVFTNNGIYAVSSGLVFEVDVFQQDGLFGFEFHNNSFVSSSVKDIYFEGIASFELESIANFIISEADREGTNFALSKTPADLPAGKILEKSFNKDMSFSADSPPPFWGINPGEKLQIFFSAPQNYSFDDLIAQINSGEIRIGLHIIALPDGSSESAINIPEPATVLLFSFGFALQTLLGKRKA